MGITVTDISALFSFFMSCSVCAYDSYFYSVQPLWADRKQHIYAWIHRVIIPQNAVFTNLQYPSKSCVHDRKIVENKGFVGTPTRKCEINISRVLIQLIPCWRQVSFFIIGRILRSRNNRNPMLFRILFQILFPIYISLRLVFFPGDLRVIWRWFAACRGPREACFTPFSRTGALAACLLLFSRAGPSVSVIMNIR